VGAFKPDAYAYPAESIRAWTDSAEWWRRIAGAGWSALRWRNLTGGIVALHAATKPSR
jgi:demethylmenaquinone methyltransferase/2-methoxy-6-polyprenyl-1,4-benzoquinol methylase